jgi:hypothetical protein
VTRWQDTGRPADAARDKTATRAARAQALAAALAVASTQDEVAEALVAHACAAFGAVGIVIARLSASGVVGAALDAPRAFGEDDRTLALAVA